jgi:hypothetical protein
MGICTEVTQAQRRKSIHQAAVDGDVDSVKKRLDEGADINEKNRMMLYTPLHGAARNGRMEVVKLLVDKGADINATEKSGMTPLMLAVQYNHKEIAKLLIAKDADINTVSRGNENAYTLAKKAGNTEIVELLAKKGAKEPEILDPYGEGYYQDDGMSPPRPGGAPRQGVTPNVAQPQVQVDLLADPNEIKKRVKSFEGLEKALKAEAAKSSKEQRYWEQTRYDNRTSLVRAVEDQFQAEFKLVRKVAVEEKAEKTTKAIDTLLEKTEEVYDKIRKELIQQRREEMAARSSSRGRGRTRGSSRSYGRGYSSRSSSRGYAEGGMDNSGAYGQYGDTGDMGMSGRDRYGRPTARDEEEQMDPETQEEIRKWLDATPDKKLELAKSIHPLTYADFAYIRSIAKEEKAEKTTACIDGLLLARQERYGAYVKKAEEEAAKEAALNQGQDPRLTGRDGDQNLRTRGRGRSRGRSSGYRRRR